MSQFHVQIIVTYASFVPKLVAQTCTPSSIYPAKLTMLIMFPSEKWPVLKICAIVCLVCCWNLWSRGTVNKCRWSFCNRNRYIAKVKCVLTEAVEFYLQKQPSRRYEAFGDYNQGTRDGLGNLGMWSLYKQTPRALWQYISRHLGTAQGCMTVCSQVKVVERLVGAVISLESLRWTSRSTVHIHHEAQAFAKSETVQVELNGR